MTVFFILKSLFFNYFTNNLQKLIFPLLILHWNCEDFWITVRHKHRMFDMAAWFAVGRVDRPPVIANKYFWASHGYHWLYRQGHSSSQNRTCTRSAIIWNLRFLVHTTPNPMTCKLFNYPVPTRFYIRLNRRRYIAYSIPRSCLFYPLSQGDISSLGKLSRFCVYIAYQDRTSIVSDKTLINNAYVHTNYIARLQRSI